MHHGGMLFGREAFGRVGVDFAWNVHVVKSGQRGKNLPRPPFYRVRLPAGQSARRAGVRPSPYSCTTCAGGAGGGANWPAS
jgi:hypothetical protein